MYLFEVSLSFTFGLLIDATGLRLRSRTEAHITQLKKTSQDLQVYIKKKLQKTKSLEQTIKSRHHNYWLYEMYLTCHNLYFLSQKWEND